MGLVVGTFTNHHVHYVQITECMIELHWYIYMRYWFQTVLYICCCSYLLGEFITYNWPTFSILIIILGRVQQHESGLIVNDHLLSVECEEGVADSNIGEFFGGNLTYSRETCLVVVYVKWRHVSTLTWFYLFISICILHMFQSLGFSSNHTILHNVSWT